jgi:hypothetical protein
MAKPQAATSSTSTSPTQFPNNGALVQTEGSPVCQVMFQQLIPLPSSTTAVSLYGDNWQSLVNIVDAQQFNSLPVGPAYDLNACLVSTGGAGAKIGVYTGGQFLWILNPTLFAQYQFDSDNVVQTPAAVINEMPQGLVIAE